MLVHLMWDWMVGMKIDVVVVQVFEKKVVMDWMITVGQDWMLIAYVMRNLVVDEFYSWIVGGPL